MVTTNFRIEGVDEALKLFDPKIVRKAARSTTTKTAKKANTAAKKKARTIYNITAKELNKIVKLRSATLSNLAAIIFAVGRPIALSKFGAKEKLRRSKGQRLPAGVTFRIKKGGKKKHLKKAFLATMSSGHIGVFWRAGKKRLPLIEGKTLSVPQMMENKEVMKAIEDVVKNKSPEIFDHELEFFLGKV